MGTNQCADKSQVCTREKLRTPIRIEVFTEMQEVMSPTERVTGQVLKGMGIGEYTPYAHLDRRYQNEKIKIIQHG